MGARHSEPVCTPNGTCSFQETANEREIALRIVESINEPVTRDMVGCYISALRKFSHVFPTGVRGPLRGTSETWLQHHIEKNPDVFKHRRRESIH